MDETRRFHTIEDLNAIEFFIKYVLKRGTVTVFDRSLKPFRELASQNHVE